MSDIPAETPRIARAYCPACEPDADTLLEILEVQWCNVHMPMREGLDDARVMSDAMLTGARRRAATRTGAGATSSTATRTTGTVEVVSANRGQPSESDQRPGVAQAALVHRKLPRAEESARPALERALLVGIEQLGEGGREPVAHHAPQILL